MLIPYGTDAPIYYRPWGTVGLLLLNVAVFSGCQTGVIADPELLVLVLGEGIQPYQWITSNFVHGDIWHLAGNMIFLWIFGQIVEGKLGWRKFLVCYMGIGVAQCAIEQCLGQVFGAEGSSYGASAIIYGLLAMAWVWAPENEVDFLLFWFPFAIRTFSLNLRTVAVLYVGLDVLVAALDWLSGVGFSSSLLHVMGAAIGFPLGVILLRRNVVDCEGWDLFSLRNGLPRGVDLQAPGLETEEERDARIDEERGTALSLMEDYLREGNPGLASAVHREAVQASGPWQLPGPVLAGLLEAFRKKGLLRDAKPYLLEAIERFPHREAALKLLLARVLIVDERRPASGLETLESSPTGSLNGAQDMLRTKLALKAKELLDAGALELEVDGEPAGPFS